jgi:hypothetical protein
LLFIEEGIAAKKDGSFHELIPSSINSKIVDVSIISSMFF